MQFSIFTVTAAALSASLALAAPAAQDARGAPTVDITFTGADPASAFKQTVSIGVGAVPVNTPNNGESVSYIDWTVKDIGCSFVGTHTGAAAGRAVELSYGHLQWGPPQPITSATCWYL